MQMIGKLGSQSQIQQAQIQETPDTNLESAKQKSTDSQQENATPVKAESYSSTQTGDYMMSGQLSRMVLDRLLTQTTVEKAQNPEQTVGQAPLGKLEDPSQPPLGKLEDPSQPLLGKLEDPSQPTPPVLIPIPMPMQGPIPLPPIVVPMPTPNPQPAPKEHVDPEYPVTPHDDPNPGHVDPEYPVTPHGGPGPAQRTYAGPNDILKQGSYGPEVTKMQQELNRWLVENGKDPIAADGSFGPKTEAALKEFQAINNLKADGLAGPNTKAALEINSLPLDPDTKSVALLHVSLYADSPAARENLMKQLKDPDFQQLSPVSQIEGLVALETNPSDPIHAQNVMSAAKEMRRLESTPEYQSLDENTQNVARSEMFKFADRPAGPYGVSGLVTDQGFSKLDPVAQNRILKAINRADDPGLSLSYRGILNSKSFEGMDDSTKSYTLVLAENNSKDPATMLELSTLMNDPQFAASSREEQMKQLKRFEREPEPQIVR
jgi:Putative peptidoglycan binding domain